MTTAPRLLPGRRRPRHRRLLRGRPPRRAGRCAGATTAAPCCTCPAPTATAAAAGNGRWRSRRRPARRCTPGPSSTHQVHPAFPVPYTIVLVELDDAPGRPPRRLPRRRPAPRGRHADGGVVRRDRRGGRPSRRAPAMAPGGAGDRVAGPGVTAAMPARPRRSGDVASAAGERPSDRHPLGWGDHPSAEDLGGDRPRRRPRHRRRRAAAR